MKRMFEAFDNYWQEWLLSEINPFSLSFLQDAARRFGIVKLTIERRKVRITDFDETWPKCSQILSLPATSENVQEY